MHSKLHRSWIKWDEIISFDKDKNDGFNAMLELIGKVSLATLNVDILKELIEK